MDTGDLSGLLGKEITAVETAVDKPCKITLDDDTQLIIHGGYVETKSGDTYTKQKL